MPNGIPPRVLKGLLEIKRLDSEAVQGLRRRLEEKATEGTSVASRHFDAASPKAEVAVALRTLYGRHYRFNEPAAVLAASVASDMQAAGELEEAEREAFIGRLVELLAIEPLWESFKAHELSNEHGRVYVRAKVITDARPVFSDDVDARPDRFVVVHSLHIHYYSADDRADACVVGMTTKELEELKAVLDRAISKSKQLEDSMAE